MAALGAGLTVQPGEGVGDRCAAAGTRALDDPAIRAAAARVAREFAGLPSTDDLVAGFPARFAAR